MASSGVKKLAEKAGTSGGNVLTRIREVITAPWTLTGPAASPENLPSLTTADHYREFSPGSPPFVVSVPHARPETTFDIKYYTRDRRRTYVSGMNPGTVKTEAFVVSPATGPITEPLPTAGTRAALQQWYAGKRARKVALTDDANNGYT